jgi:hypothetical protein
VPGKEIHALFLRVEHLDQCVGEVLLRIRRDPLAASHVFDDDGAIRLDLVLFRLHRPLVRVDVFDLDVGRLVLELAQPRPEPLEIFGLIEHEELDRRLESLQQLHGLLRQAVLAVRREVPPPVLLRRQVVDGNQNAEHHQNADAGNRAVPCIAPPEESDDFAPLSDGVEQHERQSGPRRIDRVLIPLGPEHADRQGAEDERHTDITEDAEKSLHDDQPLHRSVSTDRAVRNNPNAMKLR